MSQVVQAKCPGCQKVLRIPAEWVQQAIRCKHCGLVLQASRQVPTASAPTPAAGSPFEQLVDDSGPAVPRRRRRRGNWVAPAVVFGLLLLAGGGIAGFVFWQRNANPGGGGEGDDRPAPVVAGKPTGAFPRRALVVSVHNYLYANPVGAAASPDRDDKVVRALVNGLKVPQTQVAVLSDVGPRKETRPPLKATVEKAVGDFLAGSRPQDRVLLVFAGHAVELKDEAYLVPFEGELDNAATLLPLKWLYGELEKCPACQKVLVLDVCRFSPTLGQERLGGDPMGPKLEAALKTPPKGVQVWASCAAGQRSVETEDEPAGVFLAELQKAAPKAGAGRIQQPDDPLPLVRLVESVNDGMAKGLAPLKLEQKSWVSGEAPAGTLPYDPAEPPPQPPALPAAPKQNGAGDRLVRAVQDEIGLPPVKPSEHDAALRFAQLPPFPEKKLAKYGESGETDSPLKKAVRKTRLLLWAVSGSPPPDSLKEEVEAFRKEVKADLTVLRDGYRAPAPTAEAAFKNNVRQDQDVVARIMARLSEAHDELKEAGDKFRDAEPKRWQVNYDLVLCRLEEEIAYLYEYESMLGRMRKELPPRDQNLHGGWRLAARPDLGGDSAGKKMANAARKSLDRIIKANAETPWEVLAKREKLTNLGLEWKPVK